MAMRLVFQGRGGSILLRSVLGEVSALGTVPQTHPLVGSCHPHQRGFTSLLQLETIQPPRHSRLVCRASFFHTSPLLARPEIEEAEVEEVDFVEEEQRVVVQQFGVTPQTFVHKKEHRMTFDELYSNLKDFLTNDDYLYFKVKKVAVYHLFEKAQSKEDFQKAVEILKETQIRLMEYPHSTIKVIIDSALRTGALDEGVGLFHRSRTMAQYFNGDSFIFRLFPPPTQFNYFMKELVRRGRDDLLPILIKTFRARFFPHREDKGVPVNNRTEFYAIILRWLRTLGENEEANHIVEEIEKAAGLEIGGNALLVEAVCSHYVTGGFHDPSLASQKAREWGHPVVGDCCEVLALALNGEEGPASELFLRAVSSREAGKIFFRLMVQNSAGMGRQLVPLVEKWSKAVGNTDQHAKVCAERCLVYLQGDSQGKKEAETGAEEEEDGGGKVDE